MRGRGSSGSWGSWRERSNLPSTHAATEISEEDDRTELRIANYDTEGLATTVRVQDAMMNGLDATTARLLCSTKSKEWEASKLGWG